MPRPSHFMENKDKHYPYHYSDICGVCAHAGENDTFMCARRWCSKYRFRLTEEEKVGWKCKSWVIHEKKAFLMEYRNWRTKD